MLNRAELVHLVGDIDDARLAQIMALQPSLAEVEEAVFWADGETAELAKSGLSLTGKSGVILGIITADLEEEPSTRP